MMSSTVIECGVDVARHHAEDEIAIRQHADRLLQLVAFSIDDQKSHMRLRINCAACCRV